MMPNKTTNNQTQPSVSHHYNSDYFKWQSKSGSLGAWANAHKFKNSITRSSTVVDFGCGGGFLLANLDCARTIGIEPNPCAIRSVRSFGIECYQSPNEALDELGDNVADIIISNHALEHTLNPLQELKNLKPLLKTGGIIHFFVPCDSIRYRYNSKDINNHLFSWSPQNLGNLFTEAGFRIEYVRPYVHKWPPFHQSLMKLGWPLFNLLCRIYGHLDRSWFQVEIKARK